MAGKSDIIEDALRAAMRALSEQDATRLSRTGSDPAKFLPYTSNYRRTETSFYDPQYWSVAQDHLEYPEGTIVGTKDKLVPIEPTRRLEEVLKADPELMYRGMSAEELANFLRSREIKSNGSYNMTGQEGLTYFTSDPDSAQYYANSFAPEGHKPNMERPAYVIAAKRPPASNVIHVPGVADHEIGVNRATPVDDVVNIYRGTTTDFSPGVNEKGLYVAPRASLNWEGKSLDDVLKGRASGGSVREGYAGKGRVVGDVVEQALKLIVGAGEKAAPKVIGTDAAGRPMFDFRGAVVSHFTDPESASDIFSNGYRQVGDGYYGRAVSFTPNREYGRQFGGVETNAIVDSSANILNSGDPAHSEIIQRVLNDRTLAPTNPRPGQKTWDEKFRELGYDGLYDPGAGDLFIYNPAKVKPIVPEKAEGGSVREGYADKGAVTDPYADEVARAKALMAEKQYDDQSWGDWAGDAVGNALNTAKAILPTALGGRGEVGITDIARGAYEAGKDAVMFPGDVLMGKQDLYDERGRPLERAVGRSFNTAATLGGASSVVPRPSNSFGVFGGIKSRTADKNALTQAQIMESRGASPEEIRSATGWNRGTDEQWRYEIPDVGTTVDPSKFQIDLSSSTIPSSSTARLGDYLNHPEFFDAYPEMKNMQVRFGPGTILGGDYYGYYRPRRDVAGKIYDPHIGLNSSYLLTPEQQRSTLLHEVQHAIQQKEGFMSGANKEMFQPDTVPDPRVKIYEDAVLNDPEFKEYHELGRSKQYNDEVIASDKIYKKYDTFFDDIKRRENETGVDLSEEFFDLMDRMRDEIHDTHPLLKRRVDLGNSLIERGIPTQKPTNEYLTPSKAYEQTAGEVEARNVQKRMDMTREKLSETSPLKTQDIPTNRQLIDWNNTSWRKGYAGGGEVDDDIYHAVRLARDVGGATNENPQVFLTDAQGRQYDAQGKPIQPAATQEQSNSAATQAAPTPEQVGRRAAEDPATFDAMMERYAVPDRDIVDYEALKKEVSQQPQQVQQATHVGAPPMRDIKVDMPLFGGEYNLGQAPYNVAEPLATTAQTAYDLKTAPLYMTPMTAPIGAGLDVAEGVATGDPLQASMAALGAPGKMTKAAVIGLSNYAMDPAQAEAGPARWFSKAMEVASALPMEKMTGQQALAMLRKGTSPEELRWTGAENFLSSRPQVSKSELVDYLNKNRVQTEKIVRGGTKPTNRDDVITFDEDILQKYGPERDRLMNEFKAAGDRRRAATDYNEMARLQVEESQKYRDWFNFRETMIDAQIEKMGGLGLPLRYGPGSKFGDRYSTPGGEDYRETLISLPPEKKVLREWPVVGGDGLQHGLYVDPESAQMAANRIAGGTVLDPVETNVISGYYGHHWSEPNVVAHIRSQMLTSTPEGANRPFKVYSMDETQSDMAQDARKYGLKMSEEERQAIRNRIDQVRQERAKYIGSTDLDERSKYDFLAKEEDDLLKKYNENEKKAVKESPYIGSTQGWTDLAIKKALDDALDSGAEYFTFTPGEVQADRYSLARDLSHLEYEPAKNGTYQIIAVNKQGKNVVDSYYNYDEISETFGKEIAEKIKNDAGRKMENKHLPDWRILDNEQIKAKGDKMVDYYENIYKKRVLKVIKDATGKKASWERIPVDTANGVRMQDAIRIDDMQDARFSDFNKGGRVTGGNPYGNDDPAVSRAIALTREY